MMNPNFQPEEIMARLQPLPIDAVPDLADSWKVYLKALGFVPNSVLILQRKPKMVKALAAMAAAVWDPEGEVPVSLKRLIAHIASKAHGCSY
jgi:alkylhydroperoxidase family enzyme